MVRHGLASLCLAALTSQGWAARELTEADYLAELPTVLTASRLAQPIMDAPTAITVIDRHMIEASGFREIADLFRLVPGFYVGYFTGNRPFTANALISEYSRDMQVLVDGRSVYLPTIGGVLWSALPLSMEDIERIEVSRGPNAASYGANSFTGVINIITRHPQDVAGQTIKLLAGEAGARIGTFRWAGGEAMHHRLTMEYREDDGFKGRNDYQRTPLINYRGEFGPSSRDLVSLQWGYVGGDRGAGNLEDKVDQPHNQEVTSHFEQIDWQRRASGLGEFQVKLYHNYTRTQEISTNSLFYYPYDPPGPIGPINLPIPAGQPIHINLMADRWNLELQHTLEPMDGLRGVWGASWRRDSVQSAFYFGTGDDLTNQSATLFGHLEKRLSPEWLVNAGLMFEDHDIGGFSTSPRLSVHWQPSPRHAFRASLSQAKRYPVQFEENADNALTLNVQAPPPYGLTPVTAQLYLSSGGLRPESIRASEIGYVGVWQNLNAHLDARLFHWELSDLIETISGAPVAKYDIANLYKASMEGFDVQAKWGPRPGTNLIANYAYLHTDANDPKNQYRTSTPMHQLGLLLSQRLMGNVDAHLGYYWTDGFNGLSEGDPLPSTQRLDLKLDMPIKHEGLRGTVSLVMQNLLDDYPEFRSHNLFSRRGYVQVKLDF